MQFGTCYATNGDRPTHVHRVFHREAMTEAERADCAAFDAAAWEMYLSERAGLLGSDAHRVALEHVRRMRIAKIPGHPENRSGATDGEDEPHGKSGPKLEPVSPAAIFAKLCKVLEVLGFEASDLLPYAGKRDRVLLVVRTMRAVGCRVAEIAASIGMSCKGIQTAFQFGGEVDCERAERVAAQVGYLRGEKDRALLARLMRRKGKV